MNFLRTASLTAIIFMAPLLANAETFNLSLSVGGNATLFPEASKGYLVADTAGDGFQFLGSNSSYLLYGATTSANGTLWGANDVVVFANLETGEFPGVGRGFDTIVLPYDSTALNPNWTSGDALILVWFPTGTAGNGAGFSHYRSANANEGTIGFTTPNQAATDNIVAVGVTPSSGNITLSSNEEFVVWLFEKIFLRAPARDEFLGNLALLKPSGNLTESGLANEMLRSTAFANQDKPVYAAHYWLGIAPTSRDTAAASINLVQADTAPLTGWQPFGNSPAVPFGVTFGMANATQSILNNSNLLSGNASVVSLSNSAFVNWFVGQVDGASLTDGQKTEVANFMAAHSQQTTRQGALVSFLSGYFISEDPTISDAILGTAARWLLNDRWDMATGRPLSDAYLQLLLAPPVLSISVNPSNAGTVTQNGTSTQNGTHHVDTHVPISATPTAEYRFLNWSGNGVASPGNATTTVFLDDDRQITANFGLILTVAYDANSSTSGTAPTSGNATFGSSFTPAAAGSLARTGYTFAGWNTAANGNGTSFAAGTTATWSLSANTTLYAQWTANSYTVSYDANGSTSGTAPTSGNATFGSSFTPAAAGSLARTGYTFAGWNTAANGNGTSFAAGTTATWSLSANTTLYAQWTANSLAVSYDSQGGSAIANGTTTTGGLMASPGTPTRAGYTFNGWYEAASGGSAVSFPYTHGKTGNFTLYAQWTANSLAVSYDSQGGSAIANGTTTTGGSMASPGTPTRAGYTFNGWYEAASGGSAVWFPYTHGKTGNFTLYGQWALNSPTGDGGGSSQVQKSKKGKKSSAQKSSVKKSSAKKSGGASKKSSAKKSSGGGKKKSGGSKGSKGKKK